MQVFEVVECYQDSYDELLEFEVLEDKGKVFESFFCNGQYFNEV